MQKSVVCIGYKLSSQCIVGDMGGKKLKTVKWHMEYLRDRKPWSHQSSLLGNQVYRNLCIYLLL